MTILLFDFFNVLLNPDFTLNQELLTFLAQVKKPYRCAIFSNSQHAFEVPEVRAALDPVFEHIFKARELGLSKSQPESYRILAQKLACPTQDIFYTDDQIANVEAAQAAGCQAVQFLNNQQLIEHLTSILRY